MTRSCSLLGISGLVVAAFAIGGCAPSAAQDIDLEPQIQAELLPIEIFDAEIVAEYPHDAAAFTQGLLWHGGHLYESTGRLGTSTVRQVDLDTGEVLVSRNIPADQFGEGLALWNGQFLSLTWTHGIIHRWSADDLALIDSHEGFPFDGWGLTTLDEQLVFSDGSSTLRFLNPETFDIEREVTVMFDGQELDDINELEMIKGEVWANVWFTRLIVVIDPATGVVTKIINLADVTDRMSMVDIEDGAVLNGIAYDAENDRIFVTGKLWPSLFEIRLVPQQPLETVGPAVAMAD